MAISATSTANDRSDLYNRLMWRNRLIAHLRWLVPLLGLLVGGALIIQIYLANLVADYGLSGVSYDREQIIIDDPRYAGIMADGTSYQIVAEAARVQIANTNLIDLDDADIQTQSTSEDGYSMQATASNARLDLGAKQVFIEGLLRTSDSRGVFGELENTIIDWTAQTLKSSRSAKFDLSDGATLEGQSLLFSSVDDVWDFDDVMYTFPVEVTENDALQRADIIAVENANTIVADRLIIEAGENKAEFSGHVVVTRPGNQLWADRALIRYGTAGPADITGVEVIGNVRVETPDQTVTGDIGNYDPATEIVILSGDVEVIADSGTISAAQLAINLASNVTEFSGSDGERVHGHFNADDPVEIASNRIVFNQDSDRAEFSGAVIISQPDFRLWANRVIVHLGRAGGSDIRYYEAVGQVRVDDGKQSATGERGVYDPVTRLMRLTGNVQVSSDTGVIDAPELVVDLATNITHFTSAGSGDRVTGVFSPNIEE